MSCDQVESWRDSTDVSCMHSVYITHGALSRNCCTRFHALENDLDNALNDALENGLNYDLNCDPITVLINEPICYIIGRLRYTVLFQLYFIVSVISWVFASQAFFWYDNDKDLKTCFNVRQLTRNLLATHSGPEGNNWINQCSIVKLISGNHF